MQKYFSLATKLISHFSSLKSLLYVYKIKFLSRRNRKYYVFCRKMFKLCDIMYENEVYNGYKNDNT